MKRLKTLLALLLAVLLFAGLCLPAAADDAAPAGEDPAAEAASSEDGGAQIADQDWDTLILDLLAEHDLYGTQVAVGYLNLVTGEEHYLNPDEYMTAASMFKLPLCMYYTELLKTGKTTWDEQKEGESYKSVQDNILLYSDNKAAERLWEKLGGYAEFRRLTAPYMGADLEEIKGVNEQYNRYTARQFITCLKLLYDENERFPDIVETMKQAMPDRYFRLHENRFPIAHKFGFIPSTMSNEESALNDCGIIFTSQPFALVCFTRNGGAAEQFLTSCCTVMCDYTEAAAQEAEEKARAEAEAETAAEAAASVTSAPEASEAPAVETSMPGSELLTRLSSRLSPVVSKLPKGLPVVPLGFVVLFMVLGLIAILRLSFRYRARFFPLLFALLVSAAAMLLSITGVYNGTVYAKPSGDPTQTVVLFFDNLFDCCILHKNGFGHNLFFDFLFNTYAAPCYIHLLLFNFFINFHGLFCNNFLLWRCNNFFLWLLLIFHHNQNNLILWRNLLDDWLDDWLLYYINRFCSFQCNLIIILWLYDNFVVRKLRFYLINDRYSLDCNSFFFSIKMRKC